MSKMSEFKEADILNETIRSHLIRQTNRELKDFYGEVTEQGMYMNLTSVTTETAEIMMIFKDQDNKSHIMYFMLTYPVDNENLTDRALLNSPVLKEMHEVRYAPDEDPMRFYIREVSKLRRNAAMERQEKEKEAARQAFGLT